jgi:threonylcarbamoyladenosine tRNA methylthiotransferase MtaB
MPAVPVAERRARAATLRAAARQSAERFHAGFIGREVRVLAETPARGHSEEFAPVQLTNATPGALLAARVVAADADTLMLAA